MIEQLLQERLRAGAIRLGELIVRQAKPAGYVVRHWRDDQPEQSLTVKTGSIAALEIVRYDAKGNYRPLKGAPNLRTGWELRLDSVAEVRQTIDYFYPGAFATWLAYNRGEVTPVDLRQTLTRQTGMYRVTQKLTDSQAEEVAGRFCQSGSGCLRTILWTVDGKRPNRYLPASKFDPQADQLAAQGEANVWIPFLCVEACNLFVAEARKIVKIHST
jgi:sirohydrochlorin cobaltochelatase